ncbi:MAG: hypothetical protein Q7K33_02060 [Candidatus Berkelbacteria bacterium]|nr:hypothetical protein [Candidatus Berkelbacteria bacterium]
MFSLGQLLATIVIGITVVGLGSLIYYFTCGDQKKSDRLFPLVFVLLAVGGLCLIALAIAFAWFGLR